MPSNLSMLSRGNLRLASGDWIVAGNFPGPIGELRGVMIGRCTLASGETLPPHASSLRKNPAAPPSRSKPRFFCGSDSFQNKAVCLASRKPGTGSGAETRHVGRPAGVFASLHPSSGSSRVSYSCRGILFRRASATTACVGGGHPDSAGSDDHINRVDLIVDFFLIALNYMPLDFLQVRPGNLKFCINRLKTNLVLFCFLLLYHCTLRAENAAFVSPVIRFGTKYPLRGAVYTMLRFLPSTT